MCLCHNITGRVDTQHSITCHDITWHNTTCRGDSAVRCTTPGYRAYMMTVCCKRNMAILLCNTMPEDDTRHHATLCQTMQSYVGGCLTVHPHRYTSKGCFASAHISQTRHRIMDKPGLKALTKQVQLCVCVCVCVCAPVGAAECIMPLNAETSSEFANARDEERLVRWQRPGHRWEKVRGEEQLVCWLRPGHFGEKAGKAWLCLLEQKP